MLQDFQKIKDCLKSVQLYFFVTPQSWQKKISENSRIFIMKIQGFEPKTVQTTKFAKKNTNSENSRKNSFYLVHHLLIPLFRPSY